MYARTCPGPLRLRSGRRGLSTVLERARSGACASTSRGPQTPQATPMDRTAHNQHQSDLFNRRDVVDKFCQPLPADVEKRLSEVVAAVPGLGPSSRVIDLGSGTGCVIPHLQARGVQDILAVDVAPEMLKELRARHTRVGTLGNDAGVRTWQGDLQDVPAYMGPVDAIIMNAVFGNVHSQWDTLAKAGLLLKPGGTCVVSHVMGRAWHEQLRQERSASGMVPHSLPDASGWAALLRGLPLRLQSLRDERDMYLATMQVPPHYEYAGAPVRLGGTIVHGFGRGSRQMGVPTANIDPEPLRSTLETLPTGVYFGWARLDAPGSWPAADRGVHKMVMNVGRRPTVNVSGQEALSVEVHILHSYSQAEFYGAQLKVVALGFVRPELRFAGGIGELVARIKADIAAARIHLDSPEFQAHAADAFLTK